MTGIKLINRNFKKTRFSAGSALILAVVLTSLLAIVGVMFLLKARVDKIATSAVSENKDLNLAIDSVIAKLSNELALDVPGESGEEYYDYPDVNDPWLSSLEPYKYAENNFRWRHISDVYGLLPTGSLRAEIIPNYQSVINENSPADADGDGVADSRWIRLPDMTSSKAKAIYAAIRVIDNGGMINVNTAYAFDSDTADGSSQLQINLAEIAKGGTDPNADTIQELSFARSNSDIPTLDYEEKVIWGFPKPFETTYTPFDVSDELEFRNRWFIDSPGRTRSEVFWQKTFLPGWPTSHLKTPYDNPTSLLAWYKKAAAVADSDLYNCRHICTSYNIDRIINPDGVKMFNVNTAASVNPIVVRDNIAAALEGINHNYYDPNVLAAQIAANLIDYIDNDEIVSSVNDVNGNPYYGFERPCVYISEIAHNFNEDIADTNIIHESYAIELYKPYFEDDDPVGWQLVIDGNPITINWTGTRRFHVIWNEDPNAQLPLGDFNDINEPADANDIYGYDPNTYARQAQDANFIFVDSSVIELWRDANGVPLVVDSILVPDVNDWLGDANGVAHSCQRDIRPHRCIRRLWGFDIGPPTLGTNNTFSSGIGPIQAHPYVDPEKGFVSIGDIGMVFRTNSYIPAVVGGPPIYPPPIAGQPEYDDKNDEYDVRINLGDPYFQQMFNYFTVFDPEAHGLDSYEMRIKGRININTAPWYVIGQLPWIADPTLALDNPERYKLAQAIVAYRDKLDLSIMGGPDYHQGGVPNSRQMGMGSTYTVREWPGFASIGELLNVTHNISTGSYSRDYDIRKLGTDGDDQSGLPDLTPSDWAINDFEEADLIFARISNLVTVRSDVFTAYILVRIGTDGPQKRVIAILDRSEVGPLFPNGKVKVLALHPVPDPR